MASFTIEGLFAYVTETFTAGAIESYQGQGLLLEDAPLIQRQDPLDDFKRFDSNDTFFQEYDAPPGDDSKMGWKKSRPSKWWMSLWKRQVQKSDRTASPGRIRSDQLGSSRIMKKNIKLNERLKLLPI